MIYLWTCWLSALHLSGFSSISSQRGYHAGLGVAPLVLDGSFLLEGACPKLGYPRIQWFTMCFLLSKFELAINWLDPFLDYLIFLAYVWSYTPSKTPRYTPSNDPLKLFSKYVSNPYLFCLSTGPTNLWNKVEQLSSFGNGKLFSTLLVFAEVDAGPEHL